MNKHLFPPQHGKRWNVWEYDDYNIRMSLVIAVKTPDAIVIGSETLVALVKSDDPDTVVGTTQKKKIIKYRPDFALGIAGTFNGEQMNKFIRGLGDLADTTKNLGELSDKAAVLAKDTFKLADHHEIELVLAGFHDRTPTIEILVSKKDFDIGTPRVPYYVAGYMDVALPYLQERLKPDMDTQAIKELVRETINFAKRNEPELGGATDIKVLRP